ncbi:MAG: MaoC family dehydratase N-terminal domain-containing protein [Chloroflexota bacterium]|nr:MaoC family dehydratase N-terminal domain-containing protein [Chloroflexota bacterium]
MTQEGSIITDEMRKLIGVEGTPTVLEVEKGFIRMMADSIADPNPLWQDEEYAKRSKHGGIVAPPAFLCNARAGTSRGVQMKSPFLRALAGGDELEYYLPVRPGDVLTSVSYISEYNEREGKRGKMLFTIIDTKYTNQKGELVAKSRSTYISY